MKSHSVLRVLCCSLLGLVAFAAHGTTLSLTRGTETHLTGGSGFTFWDIQVNYVADKPSVTAYVDSGGNLVNAPSGIDVTRVQYDMLVTTPGTLLNTYKVTYQPGIGVFGVDVPAGFYREDGTRETYWQGNHGPYALRFDAGFGTYTYGEWAVEFQPDFIQWTQLGNGFFAQTATGATNHGFVTPFAILFDPNVELDLLPATATGVDNGGEPRLAKGVVLSAVPSASVLYLLLPALGLLVLVRRHRAVA